MQRNRWWSALIALALFALNLWIAGRLLRIEYTRHMHSIEGAYIAISRLLIDHWHELGWFPLWYLGIPWQNSYPPVLHVLVAGVAALFGLSTALSHHIVTGIAYYLGPVALYWLAVRLGSARFAGAGAARVEPQF